MEPEREIEKILRAYAKKRRGQSGDSFKLDPATRRMLQNEISRSESSSEDDDDALSLWEVLRRNWAFFLGFAVCIFVLASFFFRTENTAKNKALLSMSNQSLSKEDLRQVPGAAQLALAKDQSSMTNALFAKRAEPQRPLALDSDSAPAPAPALSPPVAPTPPAGLSGIPAANEEGSQTIAAAPNSGQNNFVNTMPSQSSTVLMNFHVTQNGNTIRVVDQDGSVYTGTLQPENTTTANMEKPGTAESDKLAPSRPSGPEIASGVPAAGGSGVPSQPAYSFRVGGMNRTLNQRVVFTATLIDNLETMKNTQVTFGMTANAAYAAGFAQSLMKSAQTNQTAQLPWSSLRIAGTAVVDQTNEIQINATPVASAKSMPPN